MSLVYEVDYTFNMSNIDVLVHLLDGGNQRSERVVFLIQRLPSAQSTLSQCSVDADGINPILAQCLVFCG